MRRRASQVPGLVRMRAGMPCSRPWCMVTHPAVMIPSWYNARHHLMRARQCSARKRRVRASPPRRPKMNAWGASAPCSLRAGWAHSTRPRSSVSGTRSDRVSSMSRNGIAHCGTSASSARRAFRVASRARGASALPHGRAGARPRDLAAQRGPGAGRDDGPWAFPPTKACGLFRPKPVALWSPPASAASPSNDSGEPELRNTEIFRTELGPCGS
jgi:hypothetical protein